MADAPIVGEIGLPDDEKEVADKISDQHILMLKLREIAQLSVMADTAPIFRSLDTVENSREPKPRRFNNLCILDYTEPFAVPNLLMNEENENGTMLRLSTLQLSLLVPRIRIYKIIYSAKIKQEIRIELPFDDVASRQDIERIFTSGAGRGSGTGLESFEWKSMAKNQANLAQFSATLNIFLQNIEEMDQIRNSTTVNGEEFAVSILDLLIQKPRLRNSSTETSEIYDPKYFGIKVEVGWHLDASNREIFKQESAKNGDDPEKVFNVIQKQKQIYYLTLTTHNFTFNEDGSIKLSIDYIASSEISSSDPIKANVLRLSDDAERRLKNAIEKVKNAQKSLNSHRLSSGQSEAETMVVKQPVERTSMDDKFDRQAKQYYATETVNTPYGQLKADVKQASKELESFNREQKIERMKSLIDGLVTKNLVNVMLISQQDYQNLSNLRTSTIETEEDFEKVHEQIRNAKNNLKIVPPSSLNWSNEEMLSKVNESNTSSEQSVMSSMNVSHVSNQSTARADIRNKNDKQIAFFLLGDLLDVALKHVFNNDDIAIDANNFTTKTNRILLGPITYYDFGSIEDSGIIMRLQDTKDQNGEVVNILRGKQTTVNLADIPISINEFNKWFVNNFVNKDLRVLSFLDFSKALIDDLIIVALASEGFKFAPRQQARINMLPFSAPKSSNEEVFKTILNRQNTKSFRFNLDPGKNSSDTMLKPFLTLDSKGDKQDYILFYGVNQPPLDRLAEEKSDLEQKIFHIYLGEERGLIKKANFSRDDNPRARTNNIQLNNPDKQQDGMIVREKYSGKFDFFGNFLFSPGQQLFVHPTYLGLKGRNVSENVFKSLGLGGYYFVLETNSRIMNGEFTTTVTTMWNAFGDGSLNFNDQLNGTVVGKDDILRDDDRSGNVRIVIG